MKKGVANQLKASHTQCCESYRKAIQLYESKTSSIQELQWCAIWIFFAGQLFRGKLQHIYKVRIWLCALSFVYFKFHSNFKRMSTLKFKTGHAKRCIFIRNTPWSFCCYLYQDVASAKCRALPGMVCFLPLPFKIITLMWTQNYILPSLNMAVISDSCCYWIRVWVHEGWRDEAG